MVENQSEKSELEQWLDDLGLTQSFCACYVQITRPNSRARTLGHAEGCLYMITYFAPEGAILDDLNFLGLGAPTQD